MSKANIGQVRDFGASQNPEGKMRNEISILSYLVPLSHLTCTGPFKSPNFPQQSTNSFPVVSLGPPPSFSFSPDDVPCEISDEVPPFSPPAAEYP
jgi:hypothetical protein